MTARLFNGLAALPCIPLPGKGGQLIQPVHVDDLVQSLVRLVEGAGPPGMRKVPVVGPEPLTLRGFLAQLRAAMGLPTARFLSVPIACVKALVRAGRAERTEIF